jgi:Mg/Co/Ni transporter MgtE
VLEELPEREQVQLIASLDLEQRAGVLEAMAPDDAVDLLAELPSEERTELLAALPLAEAAALQRLLAHDEHTAGGLMTPEPVIVTDEASVAEALARLREVGVPPPLATEVFVVEPPIDTPTGRFLGAVGFQRLLREPPSASVRDCLDDAPPVFVPADLGELAVAERLAEYNLLALAVCDDGGRLLGAVTVDDVLDRTLPVDWRSRRR